MAGLPTRLRWTAYVAWLARQESRLPFLPLETIEARQNERLRAIVHYAWQHVPYYRTWLQQAGAEPGDIRSASDLARLPLVAKAAMIVSPESFLAKGMDQRDGLTLLSSGTSGKRRTFRYDARALFEAYAKGRRRRLALAELVGPEAGYREAVIGRSEGASDQLRAFWEARLLAPPGVELKRCLISAGDPFPEILKQLNAFEPLVVRGYGSHLGAFFRWVLDTGRPLKKPRAIGYGGDAMRLEDRLFIERELGVPVFSNYQSVEALRIGFECPHRRGFHISMDQVVLRVVDAEGRDVARGQRGEVVLSNLSNRGTVVLNYRLGDLATLSSDTCSCGRTFPLLQSIDGRLEDLIYRQDGSAVHALTVIPQLQAVPGMRQVQIVQSAADSFLLRVVTAPDTEADLSMELTRRLREAIGAPAVVSVERVDRLEETPQGKVQTVIQRMPGALKSASPPGTDALGSAKAM
jgi:phenylacetate-CoA ligase